MLKASDSNSKRYIYSTPYFKQDDEDQQDEDKNVRTSKHSQQDRASFLLFHCMPHSATVPILSLSQSISPS